MAAPEEWVVEVEIDGLYQYSLAAESGEIIADAPEQQTVVVYVQGPQGTQGLPGANGAGFDYNQASPAGLWTIAHNLGFRPSVSTFTPGGLEMVGTVQHLSTDVLQIDFNVPVAGMARLN